LASSLPVLRSFGVPDCWRSCTMGDSERVLVQDRQQLNTPKALTNLSPGFELARTLGPQTSIASNAESVGEIPLRFANAFGVKLLRVLDPGLFQPWAEICQRLRRISN
jgi:hypothetical protein